MKSPLTLSLLSAALLCSLIGYAQQKRPEVAITITALHGTVKVGEELRVTAGYRSSSKEDQWADSDSYSPERRDFVFKLFVRDAQGALLPLTERGKKLYSACGVHVRWGSGPMILCHPGEGPPPVEIDVSKLYELNQPGQYTIQAGFFGDYCHWGGDGSNPRLSNIITVTVTP